MKKKVKSIIVLFNNYFFYLLILSVVYIIPNCKAAEEKNVQGQKESGIVFEEKIPVNEETFVFEGLEEYKEEIEFQDGDILVINKKFAVIKSNNTEMYSDSAPTSDIIRYLHQGDIIEIQNHSSDKILYNGSDDYFYYISYYQGWIHASCLEFIEVVQGNSTTLTDSKTVNYGYFPKTKHSFRFFGLESFLRYSNDTNPWVIYESSFFTTNNAHGLSIHLPDLPDTYEVIIYSKDSNLFRKYITKKHEVTYENDYDFLDENQVATLKKIIPFFTFHFDAWVSNSSQILQTEICSKDNKVLFSTNIEYPSVSFIAKQVYKGCYYLQYCGDLPVYIVLYEAIDFDGGNPIKAFSITPNNGLWEGTLNISKNLPGIGLGLILFKIDQNNPNEYPQPVENYWAYNVDPKW